MTASGPAALCDPVLIALGVPHGFGIRGSQVPENTRFPTQVHGTAVLCAEPDGAEAAAHAEAAPSADAIWTSTRGIVVGIVTADCVPILLSSRNGQRVAAIHAGWRGLAEGVIEAGVVALGLPGPELFAAVGPAARGCCYEIDEPVQTALARRYREHLGAVLRPGRPEHFQLDLPLLASRILSRLGLPSDQIGVDQRICTICGGSDFESYRRDGATAGRMKHFISPRV